MQLVLQHDEVLRRFVVRTGDELTRIANAQSHGVAGVTCRNYALPIRHSQQFALGSGMNCWVEFTGEVGRGVERTISSTQARVLEHLLEGGRENLTRIAMSVYSRAICVATQAGISDVCGVSSALHLITPSVNRQFRQLASEIERVLPFMRCTLVTELSLSAALTNQVFLLDQTRMKAAADVATIAITTPLDVEEELRLRLEHMQQTLKHLSPGNAQDGLNKLSEVVKQMAAVVLSVQPEVRQQLWLPERRPSLLEGLRRRFVTLVLGN